MLFNFLVFHCIESRDCYGFVRNVLLKKFGLLRMRNCHGYGKKQMENIDKMRCVYSSEAVLIVKIHMLALM